MTDRLYAIVRSQKYSILIHQRARKKRFMKHLTDFSSTMTAVMANGKSAAPQKQPTKSTVLQYQSVLYKNKLDLLESCAYEKLGE